MEEGCIQVYTGNGKGKTTASLGLALRAVCAGKKVYFGQFVKGMEYSEVKAEDYLSNFEIHQFGRNCFIYDEPTDEDIEIARQGLNKCQEVLASGEYDVVVLDEINIALYFELFSVEEVLEVLETKASGVEAILTGRYAPEEIIEKADLVTNMDEVKHYYYQGVAARKGIEN
ncbi:cob(I)yrinic acid a,c-diamide adenosyltransferase [Sporohalobacter salinus]|uniref:cob(I)yrinic acid a,c-diamide adenosyltransferase n=1 Tax=Sporohalobacter salinus TaxID=1494606 RepID=UPI0019609ED1|nr:cob(I)yrinic acid a,c-diamide adenosyltransferase [Sporohalobacter salinus]MBM7624424.1 cob(I)alamin adenosyltransferase [Sporohalobacter salinus]